MASGSGFQRFLGQTLNGLSITYNESDSFRPQDPRVDQNVSPDISQWISVRMPIWTTIRDQRTGALWWNTNYGGTQTAAQNFAVFVAAPYNVIRESEGSPNPQVRHYSARLSTNFKLSGVTDHRIWRQFEVGGAIRWQDKGFLGYYGVQQLPDTITDLDPHRPIWDKGNFLGKETTGQAFLDLNLRYRTRLWSNKVDASFQLNIRNLQESGDRLQPIGAFPNGAPHTYRIVDPRQFILSATFDM